MFVVKTRKSLIFFVVILLLLFSSVVSFKYGFIEPVFAAPNYNINYQGKLTDNSGVTVADGLYDMEFNLYTQPNLGSAIWTETLDGSDQVQVQNGLFSIMLGSTSPLTSVNFNQTLYLGVTIEGDSEMAPRKVLGAVPAAFFSEEASMLGGVASTSFLRSDEADFASELITFEGGASTTDLDVSGTLAIGTSSPSEVFSVTGNGYIDGDFITTGSVRLSTITNGIAVLDANGNLTASSTIGDNLISNTLTIGAGSTFGNDLITPNSLRSTGQSDEYCLTYESSGTTWEWQACGGGSINFNDLADVDTSGVAGGDILMYTSGGWVDMSTSTLLTQFELDTSSELSGLLGDETGTGGVAVFSTNPLLAGFRSSASSTIGDGTAAGGLTISGNSTTTGNAYFAANIGVGTTSPFAPLSVVNTTDGGPGIISEVNWTSSSAGAGRFTSSGAGYRMDTRLSYYDPTFNQDLGVLVESDNSGAYMAMRNTTDLSAGIYLSTDSGVGEIGLNGSSHSAPGEFYFWNASNNAMRFGTNNTERMKITAEGNVGIGTTSPYAKLSVAGQVVGQNFTATSTATSTFPTLSVTGGFYDSLGRAGTDGYVLQTTGTGVEWVATTSLGFASAGSAHDPVTLAGQDYLTLSGQQITAGEIQPDDLGNTDFGDFSCDGNTCTFDSGTVATGEILDDTILETDLNVDVAATDGDYLQYDSTGTNFTWRDASEVKTDLSLNNVENTALSTWAGSGNITTVGTITSGTWNSAITDGIIQEADLNVANGPSDEYCLTYESGTTNFAWQDCSAGSINLNDLADVDTTSVAGGDILMYTSGGWIDTSTSSLLTTFELDSEAELETQIGGVDVVTVTADDITSANLATLISNETGSGGVVVFNSNPTLASATLNGTLTFDATGEDSVEALIFDADAQDISGIWEVQDDVVFRFGTDADWTIEYDEAVDNQLLFVTTGTAAVATTDAMVEFLVGGTPTADQQVFGVAKGTQGTNTELFTVDEDGDTIITGTLSTTGGLVVDATSETNIEAAIDTLSNLTTTGALNAGSITSGFGTINIGPDSITAGSILASSNDVGALGASGTAWSDLFLAAGGVINFDAGDITLTDGTDTLTLAGGTLILPAAGLQVGSSNPFSDSAGTLTLQNVDALDATTESTVESAIDTLGNLTSASALATVGTITSGTWNATIADGIIEEADLNIANGPTDEYCLTYESGTTNFAWQDCAGGGLTLDGLTDVDTSGVAGGDILMYTSGGWVDMSTSTLLTQFELDTSSELSGLLGDETGTGGVAVFSTNPLLAGFRSSASSTIGDGTQAGGLTISGGATTTGNFLVTGTLSTTGGLVVDATSETNIEAAIDTLSNLTTTGALNAGSITSGFGTINIGPDSITAGSLLASSNDVGALGASGTAWSDLFLASGGVINFDTSDVTITDGTDTLTFAGAASGYIFSDGNVGIGTTSPYAKLSVAGQVVGQNFTATSTATSTFPTLAISGPLYAGSNAGASGYVLQTTGSGVQWVATTSLNIGGTQDPVTLTGQDYLTLSGQQITAGEIQPDDLGNTDFGDFSCDGNTCTFDSGTVATGEILDDTILETDLNVDVAATDGDYLQYDSTGTNFTWRDASEVKTDLSLNNVENTALSTWAGSANLTTTGALNSGSITSGFGTINIGADALTAGSILASSNDSGALGASGTAFSDLFLASGGVINFDTGDITLTDGADILTLAGGTLVLPASGLQVGSSNPFSDSAGTLTLQNVDALDATTESTVEAAIDTLSNLTSVGTIGTGVWQATDVGVAYGGTGVSTFGGNNHILYTTAADTLASEAAFTYDAGTDTLTTTNLSVGTTLTFSGVGALNGVDAIDATTETTIETAIDTLSNLTTTGALNSGSITSGFGTINVGPDSITGGSILASSNDVGALGASGTAWSDLFLASGGVINFDTGDITLTDGTDTLTFAGAGSGYIFSDGNVGIGTTSPYAKLSVAGQVVGQNFTATSTATSTFPTLAISGPLYAGSNAGTSGYVLQTTGSGVQWVATSSLNISGGADETTVEAYIFDNDAEDITGIWEVADDVDFRFGTDADWNIQYDEAVDNQLLFVTTNTSAVATTDPMVEFLVGTTPTADQEVFGVAKGTQGSNTPLMTLDEDGDVVFAGTLSTTGGLVVDATTETNIEAAIDTLSSLTTTGALNAGSITSGFGTINIGPDSITAGSILASSNDVGALGASGTAWSDLFLASGGVINWNAGDVLMTHSANALAFSGVTGDYTFDDAIRPASDDGASLGISGTAFSDAFLASGGVINWNAGDVTMTHAANTLTFGGASTGYIFSDSRVGVGTSTAPSNILDVAGADFSRFSRTETDDTARFVSAFVRSRADATAPGSGFGGTIALGLEAFTNGTIRYPAAIKWGWENAQNNDTTDRDAYLSFFTTADDASGGSGGTERMRIISSGDVGIGVTDPDKRLEVFETVADSQLKVSYDATRYAQFQVDSVGDLVIDAQGGDVQMNDENLWVCASGSCPTGAPSGTGNLIVENRFGVGTSSPREAVEIWNDLYVANGGATGMGQSTSTFQGDVTILGKLDVGTIDPVYTIGDTKYATYGVSSIGIKEEAATNIALTEFNAETGFYEYYIKWSELAEASDLWLFYQVTEFGKEWDRLLVSLTPSFADTVFYEKDIVNNALVIKSRSAGEISARFTADRFDAENWNNVRPDQDSDTTHFTLPVKE